MSVLAYQEIDRRIVELTRAIFEADPYAGAVGGGARACEPAALRAACVARARRPPPATAPASASVWQLPGSTYAEIVRGANSRSATPGPLPLDSDSIENDDPLEYDDLQPAEPALSPVEYRPSPTEYRMSPTDYRSSPTESRSGQKEYRESPVEIRVTPVPGDRAGFDPPVCEITSESVLFDECYESVPSVEAPVDDLVSQELRSVSRSEPAGFGAAEVKVERWEESEVPPAPELAVSVEPPPTEERPVTLAIPERSGRSRSPSRTRSAELSYAEILALGLRRQAQMVTALPQPQVAQVELVTEIVVESRDLSPLVQRAEREPSESARHRMERSARPERIQRPERLERPERPFRSRSRDMPKQRRGPEKRPTKAHDVQAMKKKKTTKKVIEVQDFEELEPETIVDSSPSVAIASKHIPGKNVKEITKKLQHSDTVVETVVDIVDALETDEEEFELKKQKKKPKAKKVKSSEDEIQRALKEIEDIDNKKKKKSRTDATPPVETSVKVNKESLDRAGTKFLSVAEMSDDLSKPKKKKTRKTSENVTKDEKPVPNDPNPKTSVPEPIVALNKPDIIKKKKSKESLEKSSTSELITVESSALTDIYQYNTLSTTTHQSRQLYDAGVGSWESFAEDNISKEIEDLKNLKAEQITIKESLKPKKQKKLKADAVLELTTNVQDVKVDTLSIPNSENIETSKQGNELQSKHVESDGKNDAALSISSEVIPKAFENLNPEYIVTKTLDLPKAKEVDVAAIPSKNAEKSSKKKSKVKNNSNVQEDLALEKSLTEMISLNMDNPSHIVEDKSLKSSIQVTNILEPFKNQPKNKTKAKKVKSSNEGSLYSEKSVTDTVPIEPILIPQPSLTRQEESIILPNQNKQEIDECSKIVQTVEDKSTKKKLKPKKDNSINQKNLSSVKPVAEITEQITHQEDMIMEVESLKLQIQLEHEKKELKPDEEKPSKKKSKSKKIKVDQKDLPSEIIHVETEKNALTIEESGNPIDDLAVKCKKLESEILIADVANLEINDAQKSADKDSLFAENENTIKSVAQTVPEKQSQIILDTEKCNEEPKPSKKKSKSKKGKSFDLKDNASEKIVIDSQTPISDNKVDFTDTKVIKLEDSLNVEDALKKDEQIKNLKPCKKKPKSKKGKSIDQEKLLLDKLETGELTGENSPDEIAVEEIGKHVVEAKNSKKKSKPKKDKPNNEDNALKDIDLSETLKEKPKEKSSKLTEIQPVVKEHIEQPDITEITKANAYIDWNTLLAEEEGIPVAVAEPLSQTDLNKLSNRVENTQVATEVTILQESTQSFENKLETSSVISEEVSNMTRNMVQLATDSDVFQKETRATKQVESKEDIKPTLSLPSSEQNNNQKLFTRETPTEDSYNIVQEITHYEPIIQDAETRTIYLITHEEKKLPPIRTLKVFRSKSNSLEEPQTSEATTSEKPEQIEINKITDKLSSTRLEIETDLTSTTSAKFDSVNEQEQIINKGKPSEVASFVDGNVDSCVAIPTDSGKLHEVIATDALIKGNGSDTIVTKPSVTQYVADFMNTEIHQEIITQETVSAQNIEQHPNIENISKDITMEKSAILEKPGKQVVKEAVVKLENKTMSEEDFSDSLVLEEAIFGSVQDRNKASSEKKLKTSSNIPYEELVNDVKTYSIDLDIYTLDYKYSELMQNKREEAALQDTCQGEVEPVFDESTTKMVKSDTTIDHSRISPVKDDISACTYKDKDHADIKLARTFSETIDTKVLSTNTENLIREEQLIPKEGEVSENPASESCIPKLASEVDSSEASTVVSSTEVETMPAHQTFENVYILRQETPRHSYHEICDAEKLLGALKTVWVESENILPVTEIRLSEHTFNAQNKLSDPENLLATSVVEQVLPAEKTEYKVDEIQEVAFEEEEEGKQNIPGPFDITNIVCELPRHTHTEITDKENVTVAVDHQSELWAGIAQPECYLQAFNRENLQQNYQELTDAEHVLAAKSRESSVELSTVTEVNSDQVLQNVTTFITHEINMTAHQSQREPSHVTHSDKPFTNGVGTAPELSLVEDITVAPERQIVIHEVPRFIYHELNDAEVRHVVSQASSAALVSEINEPEIIKPDTIRLDSENPLEECVTITSDQNAQSKCRADDIKVVYEPISHNFYEAKDFAFGTIDTSKVSEEPDLIEENTAVTKTQKTKLKEDSLYENVKQEPSASDGRCDISDQQKIYYSFEVDDLTNTPIEVVYGDVSSPVITPVDSSTTHDSKIIRREEPAPSLSDVVDFEIVDVGEIIEFIASNDIKSDNNPKILEVNSSETIVEEKTLKDNEFIEEERVTTDRISPKVLEIDDLEETLVSVVFGDLKDIEESIREKELLKHVVGDDVQEKASETKIETRSLDLIDDIIALVDTPQSKPVLQFPDHLVARPDTISAESIAHTSMQTTELVTNISPTITDTQNQTLEASTDKNLVTNDFIEVVAEKTEVTNPETDSPRPEKSPIHSLHDLLPEIDSIPEFKPSFSNTVLFSNLSADAPEFTPSYMYKSIATTVSQNISTSKVTDDLTIKTAVKETPGPIDILETTTESPDYASNVISYSSVLRIQKIKTEPFSETVSEQKSEPLEHTTTEPERSSSNDRVQEEHTDSKSKRKKKKRKQDKNEVSILNISEPQLTELPPPIYEVAATDSTNVWAKAADDGKSYAKILAEGLEHKPLEVILQAQIEKPRETKETPKETPKEKAEKRAIKKQRQVTEKRKEMTEPPQQSIDEVDRTVETEIVESQNVESSIGSWAAIVAAHRSSPDRESKIEIQHAQQEASASSIYVAPKIMIEESVGDYKPEVEIDTEGFITVDRSRRSRSKSRDDRSRSNSNVNKKRDIFNRFEALDSTLKPENLESIESSSFDGKQQVRKSRKSRSSKSKEKEVKPKSSEITLSMADNDTPPQSKKDKKTRSSKSKDAVCKLQEEKSKILVKSVEHPQVIPQTEIKTEKEVEPKKEVKLEKEVKPEKEVNPENEGKPDMKVKSEKELEPEKEVKLDKKVKPKKEVKTDKKAKLEQVVKPEKEAQPEKEIKPEKEVKLEKDIKPEKGVKPIKDLKIEKKIKTEEDVTPKNESKAVKDRNPEKAMKLDERTESVKIDKLVEDIKPEEVQPEPESKKKSKKRKKDKKSDPHPAPISVETNASTTLKVLSDQTESEDVNKSDVEEISPSKKQIHRPIVSESPDATSSTKISCVDPKCLEKVPKVQISSPMQKSLTELEIGLETSEQNILTLNVTTKETTEKKAQISSPLRKQFDSQSSTPESIQTPVKDRFYSEAQFWKVNPSALEELNQLDETLSIEVQLTDMNEQKISDEKYCEDKHTESKEITEVTNLENLSLTQEVQSDFTEQPVDAFITEEIKTAESQNVSVSQTEQDKITEEQSLEHKMADLQREIEEMLSPENDSSQEDESPRELTDAQTSIDYQYDELLDNMSPSLASPEPDELSPRVESHQKLASQAVAEPYNLQDDDATEKHISFSMIDSVLDDTEPISITETHSLEHTDEPYSFSQDDILITPVEADKIDTSVIQSMVTNITEIGLVDADPKPKPESDLTNSASTLTNIFNLKADTFWTDKHTADDAELLLNQQKSKEIQNTNVNIELPKPKSDDSEPQVDEGISVEENIIVDTSFWPEKHLYHDAECQYFLLMASRSKKQTVTRLNVEIPDQNDKDKDPGGSSGHTSEGDEAPKDASGSPFDPSYVSMDLPGGICSWKDHSSYLSVEPLHGSSEAASAPSREDILTTSLPEPALPSPPQAPADSEPAPRTPKVNDTESYCTILHFIISVWHDILTKILISQITRLCCIVSCIATATQSLPFVL